MIEEHAGDGHGYLESYGFSDDLKSTDAMLEDLRDDESYSVDRSAYLRARLFDMVIGDWDRHVDQWRWAEFEEGKKTIYRPVPRDRDMAFSDMGDGAFMSVATRLVPGLRIMEGFHERIRNVKGFNASPKTYVLDMALLTQTTEADWMEQAAYLREHLGPEAVKAAFANFPDAVNDGTVLRLQRILMQRLDDIDRVAREYYAILNRYGIVTGTDKDDFFEVERLAENRTRVSAYRNIKGKKEKRFFSKVFDGAVTKEIWIYGLDDDDIFEAIGDVPGKHIRCV